MESKIQKQARKLAFNELGIESSKVEDKTENGFPDVIFWLPEGKPFLVEFKQPGEDARPKQIQVHNRLRKLGYEVQVHDNPIETLEALIRALDTPQLSKAGRKILDRARSRCTIFRSGAG